MRGEQSTETDPVAEQHVADLLGVPAVGQARPTGQAADLLQRAGQPCGLAGELHRRRIGKRFARAADPGLDHPCEEHADVANHDGHQRRREDRQRPAPAPAAAAQVQHLPPDQPQHQDAEQQSHQPDVQAHVAVEDVAELVGDDALQLVAVEPVERAAGHRDRGIARRIAGRERIDARLVLEHEQRGHGHARGDGDFLDHVAQPAQRQVGRVLGHRHAAKLRRHGIAARTERGDAVQRTEPDDRQRRDAGEGEHAGRRRPAVPGSPRDPHRRVHRQHDADDRQAEQHQQARRHATRLDLAFEEIHAGRLRRLRTGPWAPRARRPAGRPGSRAARPA